MSDQVELPPISSEEILARFVLFSGHVRADRSLKSDAFIPPPNGALSVSRHLDLSQDEIWTLGNSVAGARILPNGKTATLYGRGDIAAKTALVRSLCILPTPRPRNHANITGWPADKPSQKILAQEIAAEASYVPFVPTGS